MTIKYIRPAEASLAEGLVAEVYSQIKKDFGRVVEPFLLHSPLPKLLAGVWMACRETELTGCVPRSLKEAVAASVSMINRCSYCVDAHAMMLDALGEHNSADSISQARYSQLKGVKTRSIVQWAVTTGTPDMEPLSLHSYSPAEVPEIIGTAVFYHYINRMATVLLGDTPLPSNKPWLRSPFRRLGARMFGRAVRRAKNPGESLRFLPRAELPADLRWAESNPIIAQAFARFSAAVEETGEQAIPIKVRGQIRALIGRWQGKPIAAGKHWIDTETDNFDGPARSAAQVALLAAIAPWQIDESTILEFKRHFTEDRSLLGALAWGSFSAARKIGTWIQASNT